jgi:hypothetical protein
MLFAAATACAACSSSDDTGDVSANDAGGAASDAADGDGKGGALADVSHDSASDVSVDAGADASVDSSSSSDVALDLSSDGTSSDVPPESDTGSDAAGDALVDSLPFVDGQLDAPADSPLAEASPPGDAGRVVLSGAVAKGPFIVGSTVVINPVDNLGNPTGQSFPTSTRDDLGNFSVTFDYRGPVLMTGSGYYFNEVENALSGSALTLKAFAEITSGGPQHAYVNAITHLTQQRIVTLVGQGTTLSLATSRAETELETALAIGGSGFDPGAPGNQLSLEGGNNVASAYAFAVGAVIAEVAHRSMDPGSIDAKLQQFINTTALRFSAGGTLDQAATTAIRTAQQCVEPEAVTAALATRFTSVGSSAVVPDINLALDSDLDGVPNASDTCPLVPNPSQDAVNGICQYAHVSATGGVGNQNGLDGYALGDLDKQHGSDVILISMGVISAWLNDGTGHFGSVIKSNIGQVTDAGISGIVGNAAVADMNGDGNADVVAVVQDFNHKDYLFFVPGDGAGHFGVGLPLFTFDGAFITPQLTLVDLDHDGRADIVMRMTNTIGIALAPVGGAWSGFTQPSFVPDGGSNGPLFQDYAVGDVSGDNIPDIVAATVGNFGLYTLIGNGDGSFTINGPDSSSGANLRNVALGDVDGDGFIDAVVAAAPNANAAADTVVVRYGNNTLTPSGLLEVKDWVAPATACLPGGGFNCSGPCGLPIWVADVTGDGKADLHVFGSGGFMVSKGRTLAAPVAFQMKGTEGAPYQGVGWLTDLNGDNRADFVVPAGDGVVATLLNPPGYHGW